MPAMPTGLKAVRHEDDRDATISWSPVPGAVGYNIRWGIGPNKLYQTYQVWADSPTTLELRALNKGVKYWYAIESFNENGVSKLSPVVE